MQFQRSLLAAEPDVDLVMYSGDMVRYGTGDVQLGYDQGTGVRPSTCDVLIYTQACVMFGCISKVSSMHIMMYSGVWSGAVPE